MQSVAERFNGAPFDIEGVFWSHRGERCTFDTMLDELGLRTEPLARLATIVRGADTARLDLAPEAPGLLAASLGLSRMYLDDLEQLEAAMTLYDAFYRWCSRRERRNAQLAHQQAGEASLNAAGTIRTKGDSMNRVLSLASISLGVALSMPAKAAQTDWFVVDTILTRTGAVSGEVHRYGLPRSDLNVTLDGVALKPGFALGGWIAFEPMGDKAMMMGDLVLTESEINPVMSKLLAEGLQVTALHNHLLRANPPTFYMHVAGTGDPAQLARLVRAALEESKTPFDVKPPAEAAAASASIDFDTAKVDAAIGHKGKANGGVYQFGIPRADSIKMDGMAVPGAMGTAIAINFQPTGGGKAAITGDFVALSSELNPLITALRDNGIEVTAIHNHMVGEEPRTFFIHFWANDDAVKLANGLGAALKTVNVARN